MYLLRDSIAMTEARFNVTKLNNIRKTHWGYITMLKYVFFKHTTLGGAPQNCYTVEDESTFLLGSLMKTDGRMSLRGDPELSTFSQEYTESKGVHGRCTLFKKCRS